MAKAPTLGQPPTGPALQRWTTLVSAPSRRRRRSGFVQSCTRAYGKSWPARFSFRMGSPHCPRSRRARWPPTSAA
eukprot:6908586-Pyramimonas_sp.AAC.1